MVIWLVTQSDALLLQLLQPLAVDLDSTGTGLRNGVVLENPACVMEEPGYCQHDRGRTVFLQMVQEILRILVALLCGLGQPKDGPLLVAGNFFSGEEQLAQHVLGKLVSMLG